MLSAGSRAKYVFIADLLVEYGLKVREPYVRPMQEEESSLKYVSKRNQTFIGFSILPLPVKSLSCSMDLPRRQRKPHPGR